jgi:4-amino-4-deoxy-L-arabinose transferase-like glycosyltransferase
MERLRAQVGRRHRLILVVLLPLLGLVMHLPIFPLELCGVHAWRQCETASNVVRFARGDMDILHPQVFSLEWEDGNKRMEFPVMQWGMAVAFRLFGEDVIWMRLISWLIGVWAVWGMFSLARSLFRDDVVALACAWAFQFSPLIFYYSVNPLPDNLALAAGIWSLAAYLRYYRSRHMIWLWVSAAALGLSVLAKLPFVVFVALPASHIGLEALRSRFANWRVVLVGAVALAGCLTPAAAWYITVIPTWTGNGVVSGILNATPAELSGLFDIVVFHFVSTLPELIINYGSCAFFVLGFMELRRRQLLRHPLMLPFVLLWAAVMAYFIFELHLIGRDHDYYLFPFLPGIFLLVGLGIRFLLNHARAWLGVFAVVALLLLPVTAAMRAYLRWARIGFPKALIMEAAELRGAVPDNAKIIAGHDLSPHIFPYHLRKRGWTFSKNDLDPQRIQNCIAQGASFLYISKETEGKVDFSPFIKGLVRETEGFKVYALKAESATN